MKWLRGIIPMMILLVFSVACEKGGEEQITASATFKYTVVDCETTINQLLLTGNNNLTFKATITEGSEWLSFTPQIPGETVKTGTLVPVVFVYLQRNTTPDDRTAKVQVVFSNNETYEVSLTQQKYTTSALFDKAWAEQPQFESSPSYIYKTYYTTLANSKYVRNYSICYDQEKRVARWVAYPLNDVYTKPSFERTDAWAYDPNVQLPTISESVQQYVVDSYGTGYARGHQCPSADRYSTIATNEQTFYATNLMPQNGSFNGGIWSTLENKIRENIAGKRDTLYVVTGTYFGDGRTTNDRKGNRIGLPTNCWKVLLRTKTGNLGKPIQNCTADELVGIGFWFSNSTSNGGNLTQHSRSIAQIEELTGFTFFRNLPPDAAAAVKAQNDPSVWKISNN